MTTAVSYTDLPPVLDVPAAAAVLGCHSDTVRALIARGELRAVRLGRLVRVPRHSLVDFLAGRPVTEALQYGEHLEAVRRRDDR